MKRILAASVLLGLLAQACHSSRSDHRRSPQISNFFLDELKTPAGSPAWDKVQIAVKRSTPSYAAFDKAFTRKAYLTGRLEDLSFKLEYGTYTIGLVYTDDAGNTPYESCSAERDRQHLIYQTKYLALIKVCQIAADGTETPVGEVALRETSELEIHTVLQKPGSGDPTQEPSGGGTVDNPFKDMNLFVNPRYAAAVKSSAAKEPTEIAAKMQKLQSVSTAFWIDRIAALEGARAYLAAAAAEQQRSQKKTLATIVVYNLPERDCAASASAGELTAADQGLEKYKRLYIDPLADLLRQYAHLRIVAIIEPDSLGNLATNVDAGHPKCIKAVPLYKEGVAYAIKKLAMAHTALYLDAAHGGWLGWDQNRKAIAAVFKEVLDLAGGSTLIRGFASNVSNYSPLAIGQPDPNPESYYQGNPARDELTFARLMAQDLAAAGLKNTHFVIDTGRNGQLKSRSVWGSWCNIKEAAIGERPRIAPAAGIDAYIWVKPPGESDGITDRSAARSDPNCRSVDSWAEAPEAGEWLPDHFRSMVLRASPSL